MSLTKEEVERIAHLARLHLSEEQKRRYRRQLSSILDHVAKLQAVDTSEVEPLAGIVVPASPLRPDQPGAPLPLEKLLGNAPDQYDDQFRVPPVLDGEER